MACIAEKYNVALIRDVGVARDAGRLLRAGDEELAQEIAKMG